MRMMSICNTISRKKYSGRNEEPDGYRMEICLESYLLVNIMMNALILDLPRVRWAAGIR